MRRYNCQRKLFHDFRAVCDWVSMIFCILIIVRRITFPRLNPSTLTVLAGTNDLRQGGTRHQVAEIIIHEEYNRENFYINDIAVVRVENVFVFDSNTAPAVLPKQNQDSAPGSTATVVGWGWASVSQ